MNEELTPLKALKEIGKIKESGCYINTTVEYKMVEAALKEKNKALEIIKNKKVCVVWLKNDLSSYNSTAALYELPILNEEEYELLKEVLL